MECLSSGEFQLELDNDRALLRACWNGFSSYSSQYVVDRGEALRVALAVEEGLLNALYHGNLELSEEEIFAATTQFHETGGGRPEAGHRPRPEERRIHVGIRFSPEQVTFTIRDGGAGFDAATLPDPQDTTTLTRKTGRGLVLMPSRSWTKCASTIAAMK